MYAARNLIPIGVFLSTRAIWTLEPGRYLVNWPPVILYYHMSVTFVQLVRHSVCEHLGCEHLEYELMRTHSFSLNSLRSGILPSDSLHLFTKYRKSWSGHLAYTTLVSAHSDLLLEIFLDIFCPKILFDLRADPHRLNPIGTSWIDIEDWVFRIFP